MSEFKCMCKKTCGEGQCKDPRRVVTGVIVDLEEVKQKILLAAAMAGRNAVATMKKVMGVDDSFTKFWDELDAFEQTRTVQDILSILQHPEMNSPQRHSVWVATFKKRGWVLGPVLDLEAKVHPNLVPYDDLPHHARLTYEIFETVVKSVFLADIAGVGVKR